MLWIDHWLHGGGRVSIRARFLGRAMPTGDRAHAATTGVSIRARFLGRAMLDPIIDGGDRMIVSIRARFLGRAMRFPFVDSFCLSKFQSAPGF